MAINKKLSNPFSTGGGGGHFEAHVQASFLALMLSGGHAPCLPCWPIVEIKLQGKVDGFDTDDLIVVVENPNNKERRKLLGQVKHSITITQKSPLFGEVMQAAWNDFNNPNVFVRGKDIIGLITGPLSATDAHNVQWLLNQAKHTKNAAEFFRNVQQANFSPAKSTEKLAVFQHHLRVANGGTDVTRQELYDFLNHFHLLGYDLGSEAGVVLSLVHSHISQFKNDHPRGVWSRAVDVVQTWNQNGGTLTPNKLPEDLLEAFQRQVVIEIPEVFTAAQARPKTDWSQQPNAKYLASALLIGGWNERNESDVEALTSLLGIDYEEWLRKAREILHLPESPLSLKNGIWKIVNRAELWNLLGSHILDQDLEKFKALSISALKEPDPAFDLPPEERYAASIHGKVSKYSDVLLSGIAEGLAMLGSQPRACTNCSHGHAETISTLVIRELLTDADWTIWGSLNSLLPYLAEAAPGAFLDAVEKSMRLNPCPFDELFSQEGNGITGSAYLNGLLWALEGLAWDEQYLVRVCVALCELASHDPGGHWTNRPSNSLVTILLPWLPQTVASVEKRKVAVQTLLNEQPDIAWNLIIQLLPSQHQTSSGSHKPSWRKIIPEDWEKGVSNQEYWEQTSFYAELAVSAAGQDISRLSTLIGHFDNLPEPAFGALLQVLTSQSILGLPEEQRLPLWDHLSKFTSKHRRFSDAKWALPDESLIRIEKVTEQLSPTNPFNLYLPLFSSRDFDLYDENGNWEEQRIKLGERREAAIRDIFRREGVEGVIRFAERASSADHVGYALGNINDTQIERALIPNFLSSVNPKHKALVRSFIWRRHQLNNWEWCDSIDKHGWTAEQIGTFLICLPFIKGTWDRALEWLHANEGEYWIRVEPNAYLANDAINIAVEKLIGYNRPYAAIGCLTALLGKKQPIDIEQCVQALLAAVSSDESGHTVDSYQITELINFLQSEKSVNPDDLFKVEWAYLPLLDSYSNAKPMYLESRLASDPDFFCEVVRLIYRSEKEDHPADEPTEESKAIATNAWRLLHQWSTPPGMQQNGTFSAASFNEWYQRVKLLCADSGHLDVALINIGEVLIHTPPDNSGLWIDKVVAAALNDREADCMRDGFRTGIYNSRGAHWVDPTGRPERELAGSLRKKAEDVENSGFQRLAVTLRELADDYDRQAERIIADNKNRVN